MKETGSNTCSIPLCRSCLAGKSKYIGLGVFTKKTNPDHHDLLKRNDLSPGDMVSTDKYEYRNKGRLPYTRGKEDPKKIFSGSTLFVDHIMGYIKICNQLPLGVSDTVRSKELYELHAWEMGIKIKKNHGDNRLFKAKAYKEDLEKRHQEISFSEVCIHG